MPKKKIELKNSLGMFDLLKGFIMILVMLSHTYGLFDFVDENGNYISQIGIPVLFIIVILTAVGKAAMPALFFMSGYGFRKMSFSKCLKKQADTLLKPYCVTAIVATSIFLVVTYLTHLGWLRYTIKETIKVFFGFVLGMPKDVTINGIYISTSGHIWFLIALIVGNILFNFLLSHFDGRKLLVVSFIIACIGCVVGIFVTVPWSITQAMVAVLYICLGYFTKKNKMIKGANTKKTVIIMAVISIIAIIISTMTDFNMALSMYPLGPLSIVVFGLFGIAITYFALYLNVLNGPISRIIRRIGHLSLYVLCIHGIEYIGFGRYLQNVFYDHWHGNVFLRSAIIFAIRLVVVLGATFAFASIKEKRFKKKGQRG